LSLSAIARPQPYALARAGTQNQYGVRGGALLSLVETAGGDRRPVPSGRAPETKELTGGARHKTGRAHSGYANNPKQRTKHARGMTKPTVLIEIAHFACPKQAGGGAGRLWRRGRPRMVLYVRRSAGHESFAHYITVLVNRWHATLCSRTVALSQARRYTAVVSNDSRIMRH